ncbi:DUF5763 domain-containing protein [Niabella terrae]
MRTVILLFLLGVWSMNASAQTVYKTPSGARYHRAQCRTVKNTSKALTLAAAREQGLTPCKICKPVERKVARQPVKKTSGVGATRQCKGMTKSGRRCRHMTRIGNGYCFQHQPPQK